MAIKRTAMKHHPNIYQYSVQRGKRYSVRRRYRDYTGKYQTYTSSGFRSVAEAEQDLRKFETNLFDGTIASSDQKRVTLDTYFDQMATRKLKLGIWKKSTHYINVRHYEVHLKPYFGRKKIQDITRLEYQTFIDKLGNDKIRDTNEKYSRNTVNRINSIMQQIMNDAELNEVIHRNKLRRISILGGTPPKDQTVTKAEYDKFMANAKSMLSKYEWAFLKILTLGERKGEILGLRLSSFKFQKDQIHNRDVCAITFNLARTQNEPYGTTLKNESSYRTIWVGDEYVDLIKYAIRFTNNILENFNLPQPIDRFLWYNPKTGKPVSLDFTNRLMDKVSKKSGIKINPHKMRHYFATKAESNRLSDTDIMHWLGHSNVQMTHSYTRGTPEGAMNVFKGIQGDL